MAAPANRNAPRADGGRDLNSALAFCFTTDLTEPPFPDRLAELAAALTNSGSVSLWAQDAPEEPLAAQGAPLTEELREACLAPGEPPAPDAPGARFHAGHVIARIAGPDGLRADLIAATPPGGPAAQGFCFERISMLSHLSFAQFANPEGAALHHLTQAVRGLAAGERDRMQPLVDVLAQMTGADHAAAALWDGSRLDLLAISGQESFTKRAALPARLRDRLSQIARDDLPLPGTRFAATPGQAGGLVLLTEGATGQETALDLAAALWAQAGHGRPARRTWGPKLRRLGVATLVLAGMGLIPVPDGISVPASVEASGRRILTAPFTAVLRGTPLPDGARVARGDVLARLDTRDIDLDLAALEAERASAVITRETARTNGNAGELRNAEIAVDRLDARLALLRARRDSAVLTAPIAGTLLLRNLDQHVGTTLRQGDQMLEVVDPARLHLTLSLPETDVGAVTIGTAGRFRPDFDPTLTLAAEIETISPAIDLSAEIPVIAAEARFQTATEGLRPGVRGVFQSDSGTTPAALVLYRGLRDWALLRLWL